MHKEYIEKRKTELTEEFNKAKEELVSVQKQAKEIDQKYGVLMDKIKMLQGAYAEVLTAEGKLTAEKTDDQEKNV